MSIDDIHRGLQESEVADWPESSNRIRPATAKEALQFLGHRDETDFMPGELVVWRDGMADRDLPAYGQVCIVTSVFNPIRKQHAAQGDILVTQDIGLGFIIKDVDGQPVFAELPFDSRRFRHLKDEDGDDRNVETEDLEDSPQR
jgi:hypothetical protein